MPKTFAAKRTPTRSVRERLREGGIFMLVHDGAFSAGNQSQVVEICGLMNSRLNSLTARYSYEPIRSPSFRTESGRASGSHFPARTRIPRAPDDTHPSKVAVVYLCLRIVYVVPPSFSPTLHDRR